MKSLTRKKLGKKILLGLIIVGILLLLVLFAVLHWSIGQNFSRGDYRDYPVATYYYDHYKESLPRQEVEFASKENILKGFIYGQKGDKLLVFVHGMGSGHEEYLKEIKYFVDHGYKVFAFDATGSGQSQGESTKGLIQSALDLDEALLYIKEDPSLRDMPLYLMGHSWGGFAVAEAAGKDSIKAIASISGYAYAEELLESEGSKMAQRDTAFLLPIYRLSNALTFGLSNSQRNAVDSINSEKTPILIVHGSQDEVIPLDKVSIIAHKPEITSPKVQYIIWDKAKQNGHMSILDNGEALDYIEEKNREFEKQTQKYKGQKEIPKSMRQTFVDSLDRELFNQPNTELLDSILTFFCQI